MAPNELMSFNEKSRGFAIDSDVAGLQNPTDILLEQLIAWTVREYGEETFIQAKDEFFTATGKVFYDDEMYHTRMHYFTCFFLFERPTKDPQNNQLLETPFELYLKREQDPLLGGYTHSLFRVLKVLPNGLQILDILTAQKFQIDRQSEEILKGINKGDYFQGFILHLSNVSILSRGLIFHPRSASHAILQSIKTIKKQKGGWTPVEAITKLARMQLKHHRLRHVKPSVVYSAQ